MANLIKVATVDKTTFVSLDAGVTIDLALNERRRAFVTFLPGFMPARLDDIEIFAEDGITLLFGGMILHRTAVGQHDQSLATMTACECADYSVMLDWYYLSATYAAATTLQVVLNAIIAALPVGYGITLDATDYTGTALAPFTWSNMRASDALRELSGRTDLSWAVSAVKVLSMAAIPTGVAPETFENADPKCVSFGWQDPSDVPANAVLLMCGPDGTALRYQVWTCVGGETSWVTDIASAVPGQWWVVEVNPVVGDTYYGTIGTAPAMFSFDAATSTLTSNIGAMAAGTVMTMQYLARYPFPVLVPDPLPGTPIVYQTADATITDFAQGVELATTLLARVGALPRTLEAVSLIHGWVPGQSLTVDLTGRGFDAAALVKTVQIALQSDQTWRYTITADEAEVYAGSYLDEWRALTGGSSSGVALGGGGGGGGTDVGLGMLNVKDAPFLATGDGVTDDTAAVQSAFDAAGAFGTVLFPGGTYLVTPQGLDPKRVFSLSSGVRVRGVGIDKTIIKITDGAGSYRALFAGVTEATDLSGFELADLTIDQNIANNPLPSGGGYSLLNDATIVVLICRGTNLWVHDCKVVNFSAVNTICLAERGGYVVQDFAIERVQFAAYGDDPNHIAHDSSVIYTEASNGVVAGNTFETTGVNAPGVYTAIEIHGTETAVRNNFIRNSLNGMYVTGVYERSDSRGLVVEGNTIEGAAFGIYSLSGALRTHTSGYGLDGVVIRGNTISLVALDAWTYAYYGNSGIIIGSKGDANLDMRGILVEGNTITFPLDDTGVAQDTCFGIGGFDLTTFNTLEACTIAGNTIVNCPGIGIRLAYTLQSVSITNNIVVNPGSATYAGSLTDHVGIYLGAAANSHTVLIAGNSITDTLATTRMQAGIWMGAVAPVEHIHVLDNPITVTGATTTAFVYHVFASDAVTMPFLRGTYDGFRYLQLASLLWALGSQVSDPSDGSTYRIAADQFTWLQEPLTAPAHQHPYLSGDALSAGAVPYYPRAEILTDGGLEAWTSATNLTNWTEYLSGTSSVNREPTETHGGTYACRLDIDAANSDAYLEQAITLVAGGQYRISLWYRLAAGKVASFLVRDSASNVWLHPDRQWGTQLGIGLTATGAWTLCTLDFTAHATYTAYVLQIGAGLNWGYTAVSSSVYLDDLSILTSGVVDSPLSSDGTDLDATGDLSIGVGVATDTVSLILGKDRTDDGASTLALVGGTTYPDGGFVLMRSADGVAAETTLLHRGTGALYMGGTESCLVGWTTSDTLRFSITDTNMAVAVPMTWETSGIDGTEADVAFFANSGYPATWRHKITSSVSWMAASSWLKFALTSGESTFLDVVQMFSTGATVFGDVAVHDRIVVAPVAKGANQFDGTLTSADLTAARTWTMPNASGTMLIAQYGGMYQYVGAAATVIATAAEYYALTQMVTGLQQGFTFIAGTGGGPGAAITSVTTLDGGAKITVNATGTWVTGQPVTIHGTTDYDGAFLITTGGTNSFVLSEGYHQDRTGVARGACALKCTAGSAGTYEIGFTSSVSSVANSKAWHMEANKNTTPLDNVASAAESSVSSKARNLSGLGHATIADGDVVWMSIYNDTDASNLTVRMINFTVKRIGS